MIDFEEMNTGNREKDRAYIKILKLVSNVACMINQTRLTNFKSCYQLKKCFLLKAYIIQVIEPF